MAGSYSTDLRSRVLAAMEAGEAPGAAARRFAVGRSTAYRWAQAARDEGRRAAKPMGGGRAPRIAGEVEAALLAMPQVRRCAVVGAPDEARGMIVKAYVVAAPGVEPDEALAGLDHLADDPEDRAAREELRLALRPHARDVAGQAVGAAAPAALKVFESFFGTRAEQPASLVETD